MHWHEDKKASAPKFYPTNGRKGKKMVGKPGRDELMREKHAKHLARWEKAFIQRHNRPPTEEEKWAIIAEGRVGADLNRLRDIHTRTIESTELIDVDALKTSFMGQKAADDIDKLLAEREKAREDAESSKSLKRAKVRATCPIPFDVMKRLGSGIIAREAIQETFGIVPEEMERYFDAFFGE